MKASLTSKEIKSLMRRHKVTIKELSLRMAITQKRVREVREKGINGYWWVRDWVEGINNTYSFIKKTHNKET
jgi:hypothetical protein